MSEELVALALFDSVISAHTKRAMARAISEVEGTENPPKNCNQLNQGYVFNQF